MRWRLGMLTIFLVSFALPVRATIPLMLEQTLQLPPCTAWDMQHWMDETSFGYAYLRADTVFWAAHIGDAEQAFRIPDSVYYAYYSYYENIYHESLHVMRHPSSDNNPSIMVTTKGILDCGTTFCTAHLFSVFDLTSGQILGLASIGGRYGDYCQTIESEVHDLTLWPPPPEVSMTLVVVNTRDGSWDCTGNSVTWEEGHVWFSSLTSGIVFQQICGGTTIRPFANVISSRFAIYYWTFNDHWRHFNDPPAYTERHEIRTYHPPADTSVAGVNSNLTAVWAQTDGNGTQRLIVDYRDGTRALNPDTYDTLWYVPQHIGGEVARFAGSADERILHGNAVYDASNGAYLDQMGPMLGSLRYIIRQPNRNSEFVTYDNNNRTVRIYTSLPPVPSGVTCRFIPESGMLRLRWQAEPGAVRYWIYASSTADGQYWPLDHVNAGTTSYDISPASQHRFFQVTAEYEP